MNAITMYRKSGPRRCLLALVMSAVLTGTLGAPAHAQIQITPTSPNGEVALLVDFAVRAGAEAEFEEHFRRSALCTRLEPGNISFDIHKARDTDRTYILYEVWRSPEALNEHFERPYTQALFAMFERNLERPVTESLRFIGDLHPAPRRAPVTSDPAAVAECR